jgi:hypothetical protein
MDMIFDPDVNGDCFSYYSTWNVKNKPKYGVHYLMVDEYLKRTVEKEKESFNKEISKRIADFTRFIRQIMEKNSADIETLKDSFSETISFIYKIIDENKLKKIKFEPEKKRVKKKKKVKEEFEEEEDIF